MVTKFILAYEVGEHTYTCKIDAPTWDEAERHLRALAATGRVSGEYVCDVPVQEPFTVLVRKHSWLPSQWEAAPRGFPDYGRAWADERINVYTAPPDDEALLRQVKAVMEDRMFGAFEQTIAALRQRLGETK